MPLKDQIACVVTSVRYSIPSIVFYLFISSTQEDLFYEVILKRNVKKNKNSENERVGYIFTINVLTRWIEDEFFINKSRTKCSVNVLFINCVIIVRMRRCSIIKVLCLMTKLSSLKNQCKWKHINCGVIHRVLL